MSSYALSIFIYDVTSDNIFVYERHALQNRYGFYLFCSELKFVSLTNIKIEIYVALVDLCGGIGGLNTNN